MTRYDIPWEDHYIGVWVCEPARELRIRKVGTRRYRATLLINGEPLKRPWMNNAPTIDLPATYSVSVFDGSDFSIDLWSNGRFALNLEYEPNYQIYHEPPCEALIVAITRDAELAFLDQYYDLLGGFGYFVRSKSEPSTSISPI
jgi:serine/threonine protein kinase